MAKGLKHPSYRQIRAIELWLAGGRKSKAQALRNAGYGESIARQPHKVFDSSTVIKELELRGYDRNGLSTPPEAVDLSECDPPAPPQIDFSQMSRETIQKLREQLEGIDSVPLRVAVSDTQKTYAPIHKMEGAEPFSSM